MPVADGDHNGDIPERMEKLWWGMREPRHRADGTPTDARGGRRPVAPLERPQRLPTSRPVCRMTRFGDPSWDVRLVAGRSDRASLVPRPSRLGLPGVDQAEQRLDSPAQQPASLAGSTAAGSPRMPLGLTSRTPPTVSRGRRSLTALYFRAALAPAARAPGRAPHQRCLRPPGVRVVRPAGEERAHVVSLRAQSGESRLTGRRCRRERRSAACGQRLRGGANSSTSSSSVASRPMDNVPANADLPAGPVSGGATTTCGRSRLSPSARPAAISVSLPLGSADRAVGGAHRHRQQRLPAASRPPAKSARPEATAPARPQRLSETQRAHRASGRGPPETEWPGRLD